MDHLETQSGVDSQEAKYSRKNECAAGERQSPNKVMCIRLVVHKKENIQFFRQKALLFATKLYL